MSNFKVSVIMPVYNGQRHIRESIESVLAQDHPDCEFIIVDDGSTDETAAIIAEYPSIVYLHQKNRGVASARNLGATRATGDFFAFIDADDLWCPTKLKKQIDYMTAHPDIGYSFTYHSLFLSPQLNEYPDWIRADYLDKPLTAFIPSALVVTRRTFSCVGPFNEAFSVSEDSEWFFRARDLGIKYGVIEEMLLRKRVHDANLSSDTATIKKNLLLATKDSIIRRNRFKISVIIPVYNGQRHLAEAVNSVLNQSFKPHEIIIVDDGSTDETQEICLSYGPQVKYLYQDNAGAAAARNKGINHSTGNYLAFLDADDYWSENRLQDGVSHLIHSDTEQIIFGLVQEFYSPDTDRAFRSKYRCSDKPIKGIHPGTMLIRKSTFMDIGLFSSQYVTGEFIEWYGRAQEQGPPSHTIQAVHMYRRIHPENHGITQKSNTDDYAKIIRDMLMRKRALQNESK